MPRSFGVPETSATCNFTCVRVCNGFINRTCLFFYSTRKRQIERENRTMTLRRQVHSSTSCRYVFEQLSSRVVKLEVIALANGGNYVCGLRGDGVLWCWNVATHSVGMELWSGVDAIASTPTCCVAFSVETKTLVIADLLNSITTPIYLDTPPDVGEVIIVAHEVTTAGSSRPILVVALVFQGHSVIIDVCLGTNATPLRTVDLRTQAAPTAAAFMELGLSHYLVVGGREAITFHDAMSGVQLTTSCDVPDCIEEVTCLSVNHMMSFYLVVGGRDSVSGVQSDTSCDVPDCIEEVTCLSVNHMMIRFDEFHPARVILVGGMTGSVAAVEVDKKNDGHDPEDLVLSTMLIIASAPGANDYVPEEGDPSHRDPVVEIIVSRQQGVQCLREWSGLHPLISPVQTGNDIRGTFASHNRSGSDIYAAAVSHNGTVFACGAGDVVVCDVSSD